MNKYTSIFAVVLIMGVGYFVLNDSKINTNQKEESSYVSSIENSMIRDGVQYVTINVKSGYTPKISSAKSGLPTKLIMKTNGTYDCSLSLVIRSLGYRNMLPNTGETTIDAGTPKAWDEIQGVCGMGMYSFVVRFK